MLGRVAPDQKLEIASVGARIEDLPSLHRKNECWHRSRSAARPLRPGRFHRIHSRRFIDVSALGAFEDSQIRAVAAGLDAGQHHATLAHRAEWPRYRNERWIGAGIHFRHVMLLPIWREHAAPKPPIAADSSAAAKPACCAPLSAAVHYCSQVEKIVGKTCSAHFR